MTRPGTGNVSGSGPNRAHRYDFVAALGSGALGALWAARINAGPELGRLVTVRRVTGDADLLDRLMVAGVTSLRFRHPGVSAVLDVVQAPGELLVVSEYVDGEALHTLQRLSEQSRIPLPPPVTLRIVLDVVTALAAAREFWKGVADPGALHGGVFPSSVFVAGFGDTLLSEVGVTSAAVRLGLIAPGAEPHDPRAPEQLAGGAADARSDVYSCGALLWELLANRRLAQAATDPVPRLDAVARAGTPIPVNVVELVARAVERDPRRRFASPEELLEAFHGLPRELVASPEQVVVAVDRLARSAIEDRHARISGATSMPAPAPESAPNSSRPTFPPEAKTALATVLRKSQSSRPPRIDYVSEEEPTERGAAGGGSVLPAELEAMLAPEPLPRRRGPLLALGVIGIGLVLVAAALFFPRADPAAPDVVAKDPPAPAPAASPAATSSTAAHEGSVPPTPAPEPPSTEASAAVPSGSADNRATRPPAVARPKKQSKPSKVHKSKTFRPSGI